MLFGLASCGSDDDGGKGNTNGLYGWYINKSSVAKASDFDKINTAIANHELLTSYYYGGEYHNYYATRDLFIDDDGSYSDSHANFGKLRFSVPSQCHAIQIVNDNTIKVYYAWLYVDGKGTGDAVYRIYAGSVFGNMTYYGMPTYKTYTRMDDKLFLLDGTIYTITANGLVMDGSSEVMEKYDPSIRR